MPDKPPTLQNDHSADWFVRGALSRIGEYLDLLTGRKWTPSSSLATSELIERLKKLLDSEARSDPEKGVVVPHNIKLKMQWDKFSTDAEDALARLEIELLTAAADHINDSLYYTSAPLAIEVKPDYFTEGVKLYVSFDDSDDDESEAELNVTMPLLNIEKVLSPERETTQPLAAVFVARFHTLGVDREKELRFPVGDRFSVGRGGGSDLLLDDPSVSKIHASLAATDDGVLSVADTGSTNGTFISGDRISYGKAIRLSDGDRVTFGTVEVKFERVKDDSGGSEAKNENETHAVGSTDTQVEASSHPASAQQSDAVRRQ